MAIEVLDDQLGSAPVFLLYHKGELVGRAFVSVQGTQAELVDIIIQGPYPGWGWIKRAINWRHDFRGRGAGTYLLSGVLDELARRGVRRITGRALGPAFLPTWYKGLGFVVDNVSGEISRDL
jgi:hypothetical protein